MKLHFVRTGLPYLVIAAAVPLWLVLATACGDDDEEAADTGGQADTGVADTGAGDAAAEVDASELPEAALGLQYVWSVDGSAVFVVFTDNIDPESADDAASYSLVASDGSEAAVVPVLGSVPGVPLVELTVEDPGLDPDLTWDLTVTDVTSADGAPLIEEQRTHPVMATAFLNLVWHQHQPSYLDPALDELQGPWVRKHATKDYFDMTAVLRRFPDLHFNVNLTSSLLNQLEFYIERLGPYVDVEANEVDESAFLAEYAGRTDPWIDLLLEDTPAPADATEEQLGRYYADDWSTWATAEPLRAFFPDYEALIAKGVADATSYTQLDLLHLKLYFEIAWMDPDFLTGPVTVYVDDDGNNVVVDLSDVVVEDTVEDEEGGSRRVFRLHPDFTEGDEATLIERGEALANRLVAENYKIMVGVLAVHTELLFDGESGQVEVLTTPFYHPILPLLYDTDLAAEGQPAAALPDPAFSYPEDVETQIALAVEFYTRTFGQAPRGMWPSEGAVAEEIVPAFREQGIDWIATDRKVLERGRPDSSHLFAYRVDADTVAGDGGDTDDEMMVVFRDTGLSDKVGFFYQSNPAQENATDFMLDVLGTAPRWGEPERLLTVILDGENAWEWYVLDHDAKAFFDALYSSLTRAHDAGMVMTVTGSEYIDGNAARGVDAHPVSGLDEYEDLFPGSWDGGTLATWIGEQEENLGWSYLVITRADLQTAFEDALAANGSLSDAVRTSLDPPSESDVAAFNWWRAWQAMYAAEGSDWFWWYGTDKTARGGDAPYDVIFRSQLQATYDFMNAALAEDGLDEVELPVFPPVIQEPAVRLNGPFATPPTLDGEVDPAQEWGPPAGAFFDNDSSGTEPDDDDDIARVYFGYEEVLDGGDVDDIVVYLGILFNAAVADLAPGYRLAVYTNHQNVVEGDEGIEVVGDPMNDTTEEGLEVAFRAGGAARQVRIDWTPESMAVSLAEADGTGGWDAVDGHSIEVGAQSLPDNVMVEMAIPLSDLGMLPGDPFEFMVVASDLIDTSREVIDIAPNIETQVVFVDPTKLVTVIFELDATGDEIPLEEHVPLIRNPPPPDGDGAASIVGNQRELGDWTPNSVFLSDDGADFDLEAGDNYWTGAFAFPEGTWLEYKYTIGHPGDGWGATEEYPLTNRGYLVPADGTRRVRIHDIFADRPDPTNTLAPNTQVTIEE
jgi:alpha-amylase/alpha-mannosidase (GH57 family)